MKLSSKKINDSILLVVLFLGSFAFYLKTMAPTVLWSDTAKLAIYVKEWYLGFAPDMGTHPLHTVFGKPFSFIPLGNFAYRQNLMSAVFASLTILLLFLIIKRITKSEIAALLGSLTFAVSQMFWFLAVMNESYTLVTFFIALQILLLLVWADTKKPEFLWLWAFVFGFSFANNWLPLFCFPGYLYYIFASRKAWGPGFKSMCITGICFSCGSGFLIWLFWTTYLGSSASIWKNFFQVGQQAVQTLRVVAQHLPAYSLSKKYIVYLMYQFPIFGFFLGLMGVYASAKKQRQMFFFLLLLLLPIVVFGLFYPWYQRSFNLFIPSYLFFAIWIGIGAERLLQIKPFYKLEKMRLVKNLPSCHCEEQGDEAISLLSSGNEIATLPTVARNDNKRDFSNFKISGFSLGLVLLVVFPVCAYYITPGTARRLNLIDKIVGNVRRLHYRDTARFYLWPAKNNEFGPYKYAVIALETVKPNSVILADFNPGKVIEYFQKIDGKRPDVKLAIGIDTYYYWGDPEKDIVDFIDKWIETNPVYLADDYEPYYFCRQIKKKYDIIETGSVFEIQRRNH